jgi:hypothetical protein
MPIIIAHFWLRGGVANRFLAVLFAPVACIFLMMSLSGVIGFGARERIAVAESTKKARDSQAEAIDTRNQAAIEIVKSNNNWFQNTFTKASTGERKQLLAAQPNLSVPDIKEKPPEVTDVMADPQAAVIASWTGWKTDAVQSAMYVALGLAMLFVKATFPAIGMAMWPAKASKTAVQAVPDPNPLPPSIVAAPSQVRLPVGPRIAERQANADHVKRFLKAETVPHPDPEYREQAGEVYRWYQDWVARDGSKPLHFTAFGHAIRDCGVQKVKTHQHVYYYGVSHKAGNVVQLRSA